MRSLKFIRSIFILALFAISPSFAQQLPAQAQMQLQQQSQQQSQQPPLPAQQPPDWTACKADNQCTVIDACGDKAINTKYVAAFNTSSATLKCKKKTPFHANASARCLNKKCIVMKPGS